MEIQFKKGVIELCILSMLQNKDKYGYELSTVLSKTVNVSDGAIYPVLKRLNVNGYLDTYLRESSEGPARKYFTITSAGRQLQKSLANEWKSITGEINLIVGKGKEYEQE